MEEHIFELNTFCRFCKSKLSNYSYKVSTYSEAINYIYREEGVDVTKDDPNCQSKLMCKSCYRNAKKSQDALKFKKKNPKSSKTYQFDMPSYKENVNVYKGRLDRVEQPMVGGTPSKVRKLSGEPLESPSDKLSVREQKKKTPVRKSVKFDLEKMEADFETGDLNLSKHAVVKVYTSQDSVLMDRVSNPELARFFACRVCGKYPRESKVSVTCMHIFCKVCIENYKENQGDQAKQKIDE